MTIICPKTNRYCELTGCNMNPCQLLENDMIFSRDRMKTFIDIPNPEVSDTTTDDSKEEAGSKIKKLLEDIVNEGVDVYDKALHLTMFRWVENINKALILMNEEANTKTPSIYPRWVRAVDRLPDEPGWYFIKAGIDKVLWTRKKFIARVEYLKREGAPGLADNIFWLDENPDPVEPAKGTI